MSKYIDADLLKRKFRYSEADTEDERIWTATMRRMIDETPAADVEPVRHGYWIEENEICICSECGEEHSWGEYRATYCDVCGAKMDGGNEENVEPCVRKNIKRASNDNPCIGYGISEDNDETCDMCKACVNCETHVDDVEVTNENYRREKEI